jgi:hypothetical protein
VKRIHLILFAAIVMSAIGSIGASSALAIGPLWLVEGEGYHCRQVTTGGQFTSLLNCLSAGLAPAGSEKWELLALTINGSLPLHSGALILSLSLSTFTLKAGSLITIECKHEDDEGTIQGGVPGKNHELVTFLECSVNGHEKCTVNSPEEPAGKIMVTAKTELVLRKEGGIATNNLLDLFEPESGETFVRIVLTSIEGSGHCPIFTEGETEVKGSVAAQLEPEVEGAVSEGMLTFPTTPIKEVYRWTGESGGENQFKKEKVSLKAFGIIEDVESGLADVHLTHGGKLGAHCGCL